MSQNIDILKSVTRIIKDNCTEECLNRCGICTKAVCQDVIIQIGCFFLHCAEKEHEEKEKQ